MRVVAAVVVADEDHAHRDTSGGEGGVIRGGATEMHHRKAELGRAMLQIQPDQWIDRSDRGLRLRAAAKADAATAGDAGDDCINPALQLREYRIVIGPHIKAEIERARHDSEAVLCRI